MNQSEIKISFKQLPNFMQIVVEDNGCGVQVFKLFDAIEAKSSCAYLKFLRCYFL